MDREFIPRLYDLTSSRYKWRLPSSLEFMGFQSTWYRLLVFHNEAVVFVASSSYGGVAVDDMLGFGIPANS